MRRKIGIGVVIIVGMIFTLPLLLTVTNSLMRPEEMLQEVDLIRFIPQKLSIRQYYILLFERSEYLVMFWKSVWLAASIVIGNSIYSIFVGTMLAKAKMRGKHIIVIVLILGMLMPYQIHMLPHYKQFKLLGILETDMALILPMIVAPFGVVVVTLLVSSVPDDLIEAIRLETNQLIPIFMNAVWPNCRGGITILIIFIFSEAWNMVEQPMMVYSNMYKQPLSIVLAQMKHDPSIVLAASIIYMIPVIISYVFFEESLNEEFLQLKV